MAPSMCPNEPVIVPNYISFVEESKIFLFQKKNRLGAMKGSFGHHLLFRHYSGASRALAWHYPHPPPLPPRMLKHLQLFCRNSLWFSCRLQSSSICYVPMAPAAGHRSYSRALRRFHAVLRSFSR